MTLRLELCLARPWPMLHWPTPWTTDDVARRLGVTSSLVSSWKQGRARPTAERLSALLDATSTSLPHPERDLIHILYGYLPEGELLLARQYPGLLLALRMANDLSRFSDLPAPGWLSLGPTGRAVVSFAKETP